MIRLIRGKVKIRRLGLGYWFWCHSVFYFQGQFRNNEHTRDMGVVILDVSGDRGCFSGLGCLSRCHEQAGGSC